MEGLEIFFLLTAQPMGLIGEIRIKRQDLGLSQQSFV